MSVRPDIGARERVVGRHASVRVDAEDLAAQVARILRERTHEVLAHRPVDLAVGPEPNGPTIVVAATGYAVDQYLLLASLPGLGVLVEARQPDDNRSLSGGIR